MGKIENTQKITFSQLRALQTFSVQTEGYGTIEIDISDGQFYEARCIPLKNDKQKRKKIDRRYFSQVSAILRFLDLYEQSKTK